MVQIVKLEASPVLFDYIIWLVTGWALMDMPFTMDNPIKVQKGYNKDVRNR